MSIGTAMFAGAGVGGALGLAGGITYGVLKANAEINSLPTETVTLRAHQEPVYEKVLVSSGNDLDWGAFPISRPWAVTADAPKYNPDGSIQMKDIGPQTVTGHGKATVSEVTHDIMKPTGVNDNSYPVTHHHYDQDGHIIGSYTETVHNRYATYSPTGQTWSEQKVNFDTGVNRAAYIGVSAVVGLASGAVGGALVGAALYKTAECCRGHKDAAG